MILLEQERKKREMSQQRLSELSGISQQAISAIESGARENPGIETMWRLAIGLGCHLNDIYQPDVRNQTGQKREGAAG